MPFVEIPRKSVYVRPIPNLGKYVRPVGPTLRVKIPTKVAYVAG